MDPPSIVALKRSIDKKIHLAGPLFSEDFFGACMDFQNLCFHTYTGWGQDARLRTPSGRRQQAYGERWKAEWSDCFSDNVAEGKAIKLAYQRVMEIFARDIGVHNSFVVPASGRLPTNIA